tara:strand:- start:1805 stop:2107 length:303 start_codon:yes stop_codon:yes gene_type:complete
MKSILSVLNSFDNFVGGLICPIEPTNEAEYQELITNKDNWVNPNQELWNGTPATWQEVLDKKAELEAEETSKTDLKASAKAKLVAGEKLTEEEANVLVGV